MIDWRVATPADRLRAIGEAMIETVRHRGPDAGEVWVEAEGGVALGQRRLAIIDLSPGGAQPMHSADRRYVITFNGEIYNYRDIRRELEAVGRSLRGAALHTQLDRRTRNRLALSVGQGPRNRRTIDRIRRQPHTKR